MVFSLLESRSWMYIRVPYHADTHITRFEPCLEFTITILQTVQFVQNYIQIIMFTYEQRAPNSREILGDS